MQESIIIPKSEEHVIESDSSEDDVRENHIQLVIFNLGSETYGIEILDSKEIIKTEHITRIPNMPGFIQGVINLRGKIIVVLDLAERFGLNRDDESKPKHIIVVFSQDKMFGFLVDEVTEVVRISEKMIKESPSLLAEKVDSDYIKGIVTLKNRLVVLLDVAKIVSNDELSKIIPAEKNQAGETSKHIVTKRTVKKKESEHKNKTEEITTSKSASRQSPVEKKAVDKPQNIQGG